MKSLVGIYQEKEQIDSYLGSLGINHDDIMEVGPFFSQRQAVDWMEFMKEKINNCELTCCSAECRDPLPWYGFAFPSFRTA